VFGRVPAGGAFGTRFFICSAEQIKRAQTMPLSLTQNARFKIRSLHFDFIVSLREGL